MGWRAVLLMIGLDAVLARGREAEPLDLPVEPVDEAVGGAHDLGRGGLCFIELGERGLGAVFNCTVMLRDLPLAEPLT